MLADIARFSLVRRLGKRNSGSPAYGNGGGLVHFQAGTNQTTAITVSGGAQFLLPSLLTRLNLAMSASNAAVLNLDGGTFQTLGFSSATNVNENAVLNFNGGTLEAGNAASTTFLAGLASANVYSGGGTINNNGKAITIGQALLGVSGSGVTAVAIAPAGPVTSCLPKSHLPAAAGLARRRMRPLVPAAAQSPAS